MNIKRTLNEISAYRTVFQQYRHKLKLSQLPNI